MSSVGRNDKCPCGSDKKYKKCCGQPGRRAANDHRVHVPLGDDPSGNQDLANRIPDETGMYRPYLRGRRFYVFTPLPAELKDEATEVCSTWAEENLVNRDMLCDLILINIGSGRLSPKYCCSISKLFDGGEFGDEVEEWGKVEFFKKLQKSFAMAVNNALEKKGLPRSYEVIPSPFAGQNYMKGDASPLTDTEKQQCKACIEKFLRNAQEIMKDPSAYGRNHGFKMSDSDAEAQANGWPSQELEVIAMKNLMEDMPKEMKKIFSIKETVRGG
jgi:hypothetical protein